MVALVLSLALLGDPTSAVARSACADSANGSGPYDHRVEKVTDRVYLIYRPDPERVPVEGNVEVIEQSDGLVVVDAGGSREAGADIVRLIRCVSALPVKDLVYTHWHGDHNLGSPALKAAWPSMNVISTQPTRLHLTDGSEHVDRLGPYAQSSADRFVLYLQKPNVDPEVVDRLRQIIRDTPEMVRADSGASAVIPDEVFGNRLYIDDAVAPAEVTFPGRANTDGDAVVWLYHQKVLITGDIVVAPIPYGSESYPEEWKNVLHEMDGRDFAYLIPGHGAVQKDHAYLKQMVRLLDEMRKQIDPLVKQGLSLEEIQKRVDFTGQIALFAGTSAYRKSELNGYFLSSMINNVYLEAKGLPIAQGQPFFD
jgi:glyoxylase-like metal-dependent hydrolase (beta-lactamase superfamily II)